MYSKCLIYLCEYICDNDDDAPYTGKYKFRNER